MRFAAISTIFGTVLATVFIAASATYSVAFAAFVSPGTPTGYVNDFANIIPVVMETDLEQELARFAAERSTQIVVATVNSLDDNAIEIYANELFREWGIGTEAENNGVLFLIAPNEREARIEVGYGLEGALTDALSNRILDQIAVPQFAQGNYGEGIVQGARAIQQAVQGEEFAVPQQKESLFDFAWIGIFGIILLQWILAILGRTKSWWLGGVLGGIAGVIITVLTGFLYTGLFAFIVLIPFGFFLDFIVSRAFAGALRSGTRPPWYSGGSWGGGRGSSSSGGFGGFGGGSSGGGGASGSW